MFNIKEFLGVAVPPVADGAAWYENATDGVSYLKRNANSREIVLCTNVGQSLIHAVLAPLSKITPPDGEDLMRAHVWTDSHWALEHVSGGGEPDRMYLSEPLDRPGCNSLAGGEQLIFRRSFEGVDKGKSRTSISQRLEQALDIYWQEEESAYCRLNEDGDVVPVVKLYDLSAQTGNHNDILVTIDSHQLHRYMAVTETALVMKFDFTRYRSGFMGWHSPVRNAVRENDLYYDGGVQAGSSFVNGVHILRPDLSKNMLIAQRRREWTNEGKQYATFKAHDWKNNQLAEISCSPTSLTSYFDNDPNLPFQITPAFFKPEVLQKYKADLEKYRLENRSISSRAGWHLKTYDVNDAGQVFTYLHYLGDLPHSEQIYWQSFNEWPKAPISKRAIETDFEGNFSTISDPLSDIKYEVARLDKSLPYYWKKRGDELMSAVHYPLTSSVKEWSNAILALDQIVIEGFSSKHLRKHVESSGRIVEKEWRSIKLLQEILIGSGISESIAVEILNPLKHTHDLRSKVNSHSSSEKDTLVKQAKIEHGSLAMHFRNLASDVQMSFNRIIESL